MTAAGQMGYAGLVNEVTTYRANDAGSEIMSCAALLINENK